MADSCVALTNQPEAIMRTTILTAVAAIALFAGAALPAQADPGWGPRGGSSGYSGSSGAPSYHGAPGGGPGGGYHYQGNPTGPRPGFPGYMHGYPGAGAPRWGTHPAWREIHRDRAEIRQDMREIRRDIRRGDWHELHRDRAELARDRAELHRDYRALHGGYPGHPHR